MQLINHINYYPNQPEIVQEHRKGILVNDLFSGIVEHGGKYRDTYYYIDGHELSRNFGGDDGMEALTQTAIEFALGTDNVVYPDLSKEFQYAFNEDSGQPKRTLVPDTEIQLEQHITINYSAL